MIVENLKELNANIPFSEILELLKSNNYLFFETMFFLSMMKDQPAFHDLLDFNNPQTIQLLQLLQFGVCVTTYFAREQYIVALQAHVQDLQTGNAWLESQRAAWESTALVNDANVRQLAERLEKIQSHRGVWLVNRLTGRKLF